jgi:hypothetical protein
VAINYHPTEQPDADEVIALIKEAGANDFKTGSCFPVFLSDSC